MIENYIRVGEIGSLIDGTLRIKDLIPAFRKELQRLDPEMHACIFCAPFPRRQTKFPGSEYVDDLISWLNLYSPEGCYFGAYPSDRSNFGFWLYEDE